MLFLFSLSYMGGVQKVKRRRIFILDYTSVSLIRESTEGVLTTPISLILSTYASSNALTMMTTPGVPEGSSVSVVALLLLLFLRDFLPLSRHWGDAVKTSLNMGILPLLFTFGAIALYKLVITFKI